jgi:hypothetical protein
MKQAPHEIMNQDENEYAERAGRAYAISCSQHDLTDGDELRAAFWAGFKSACSYLRAPGINRAAIVEIQP